MLSLFIPVLSLYIIILQKQKRFSRKPLFLDRISQMSRKVMIIWENGFLNAPITSNFLPETTHDVNDQYKLSTSFTRHLVNRHNKRNNR